MTPTDYRNFSLLIARVGDRYRAFVVAAPAGTWLRDILNYPIPNPIAGDTHDPHQSSHHFA